MSSWVEFWNGATTIYVNPRHSIAHYRQVAEAIAAKSPGPHARILDYGCGRALSADLVADACAHLYLCDSAASVRQELVAQFAARGDVTVFGPEDLAAVPDGSIDLFVVNSVIQYLSVAELKAALTLWRRKLAPQGALLLADVIPPGVTPLTDAAALLRFASANGFLAAACGGLVKTFFSDYRRLRAQLGLQMFQEAELLRLLADCGFDAKRQPANLGHNPARMTFIARVQHSAPSPAAAPASSHFTEC